MPISNDETCKIEKAFQDAINLESKNIYADSTHTEFDKGVIGLLPNLYDLTFNQDSNNYDGVIFNQYKIIKQIGSGGMGNVYLAERIDGQFDKIVAIKVLTKGFNNQNIKDRFLQEKQILAQLRHPNIVPLLDAGTTDDGIPWFVLEYIDGFNIGDFCQSQELSIEEKARLMMDICDAIHFAHNQGVIHRDIKPANILIENRENNNNPIILDFGIAHQDNSTELTNQGNQIGTPGYMSPEQIKGKKTIDQRSDVFSLGVVMYEIFSNLKPFKANSAIKTYYKTINTNPKKLTNILPAFPKDLQIIVETCLQKKRQDRYQSALNVKQDIENWLNGYPILAKKESFFKVFWRIIKRNTMVSFLVGTILLMGVFSAIKYTYDIRQEKQIALQAKAESDDLFNFLLEDLHQELTNLGQVNLLQSVAEKNLQHLNKYNFKLSNDEKIKYVKSYRNIASVLEMQQDASFSLDAYTKAIKILLTLNNDRFYAQQKISLLALSYSDLASLNAKLGNLDLSNQQHKKARAYAQQLIDLDFQNAVEILWSVIHPWSWNLMEQSQYKQAKIYLDQALLIASQEFDKNKQNRQWLDNQFKSLVALGWYYIDVNKISLSLEQYKKATSVAKQLLSTSPNSIPYTHNLQKTNNQMAYAYISIKNHQQAIDAATKAIEYGKLLHLRAPDNHIYYRALSYSYTIVGDAYNGLKQYDMADKNFKLSLDISQDIAHQYPKNTSLQNDLAIDMINFANLQNRKGDTAVAEKYWQESQKLLEKFATNKDASIYYVDTYVNVLLIQGEFEKAKPYLLRMKNTSGWPNEAYTRYVEKYNLTKNIDHNE